MFYRCLARAACAVLFPVMLAFPAAACPPEYFSASDQDNRLLLRSPTREYTEELRAAKRGDVASQRNLGVMYEAGYLVGKCLNSALYWYEKAAKNGDRASAQWVNKTMALYSISQGPDFLYYLDGAPIIKPDPARGELVRMERTNQKIMELTEKGTFHGNRLKIVAAALRIADTAANPEEAQRQVLAWAEEPGPAPEGRFLQARYKYDEDFLAVRINAYYNTLQIRQLQAALPRRE